MSHIFVELWFDIDKKDDKIELDSFFFLQNIKSKRSKVNIICPRKYFVDEKLHQISIILTPYPFNKHEIMSQ